MKEISFKVQGSVLMNKLKPRHNESDLSQKPYEKENSTID